MWPSGAVNYFIRSTLTVGKDMRDFLSDFNSMEGNSRSNSVECNSDSNSNSNDGSSGAN